MAAPANRRVILNPENELNNIPIKRTILNPENELNNIAIKRGILNPENEIELEINADEANYKERVWKDPKDLVDLVEPLGINSWDLEEIIFKYLTDEEWLEFGYGVLLNDRATIERLQKIAVIKAKKASLKNIREQKSKNEPSFVPSDAYGIFGHGEEHPYNLFIVPKNCIVVVKAAPGERTYYTKIREYLNRLFTPGREHIYKDPLRHLSEIINDFGSVRIYKPGEICPSFTYYLRPSTEELGLEDGVLKTDDTHMLQLNQYGVVNLKNLYKPISDYWIYPTKPANKIMFDLYFNSKFPTLKDCKEWLEDTYTKPWKETVQIMHDEWIDDMPTPNYLFPADAIATQYELFGYDPTSGGPPKRPGVYYNFICRSRYNSENTYIYNNTRGKENIRTNLPTFFTAPAGIKKILGNRILEAETARKHLIPGTKFNQPARTRRNRRSRRQRKSRRAAR